LYDTTSTRFAITTIEILDAGWSKISDYTKLIKFNQYIENDEIHSIPYNCTGVIPNYKFVIGDETQFKTNYKSFLKNSTSDTKTYVIEVRIPFHF
jgi:hypothetical protein